MSDLSDLVYEIHTAVANFFGYDTCNDYIDGLIALGKDILKRARKD